MTEFKAPSETAKPIGRWAGFWRKAGQALRALVGAKTGLLIFLALTLGCAKGEVSQNIKEFINGFVGAPAVTPTPTPSSPPVVIEPTPTNTPVITPTATIAPPTPTPEPSPTVPPRPTGAPAGCAAVEGTPHTMAPGNHCHAYNIRDGEVHCLEDSTIRPICDTDHMDNWNTFCGKRTHDPDYTRRKGAMEWTITGARDLGPNGCETQPDGTERPEDECENSAQRWISGEPGAQVSVTVCIPKDKRTPDGCLIIRQGDGCGSRVFTLPEAE